MTWLAQREEALVEAEGDVRRVSLSKATAVAAAFFQEEVLPRMQTVVESAKDAGLQATLRVGEELPRPWRLLDRAEVAVRMKVGGRTVMAAELEVYCDGAFECHAVTRTKEGRTLSLLFTVAGEPIQHLETVFREFAGNIGLETNSK
jgi:hypothetical protein